MEKVVYTNYWVDRYTDARKEHGSYLTEEEALNAIYTCKISVFLFKGDAD